MLAQQRHTIIMDLLNQNGNVRTSDLVAKMNVSSETIRKDFDYLEQKNLLLRVHGGAVPVQAAGKPESVSGKYISFQTRNSQHMAEKTAIARYAASLVKEGQIIALDYGSTSQVMAKTLKNSFRNLTVITNSIQNVMILSECPGFTVILTGGVLSKEEFSLSDEFSPMLEHLHVDILFMTVTGVDPVIGLTDQRFSEAKMQNQMRKAASRTIVLADSSKFGSGSLIKICSVRDVDSIITDDHLPETMVQSIRQAGTELILVPAEA